MCKRKIVYVLAAVALTATGANFANRTCLAGPEKPTRKNGVAPLWKLGVTVSAVRQCPRILPGTSIWSARKERPCQRVVAPRGEVARSTFKAVLRVTVCAAKERTSIQRSLVAKRRLKATTRCQQSGVTGPTRQRYGIM